MKKRLVVKGHKLTALYSFDSVSHKSMVECECGWKAQARSSFRGREQHNEHKQAVLRGEVPDAKA